MLFQVECLAQSVTALAFHPKSNELAVGTGNRIVYYTVPELRPKGQVQPIEGGIYSCAYDKTGVRLYYGGGTPGQKGAIGVIQKPTNQKSSFPSSHRDLVYSVRLSPDQSKIATVSYDHQVYLWDAKNPKSSGKHLRDHTDSVYDAAFSPNGKRLATVGADRTVKIWDVETGKRLYTLSDSTGELYCVAYHPDGKRVAAAGTDKTIRVWTLGEDTGELVRSAFAHDAAVLKMTYSTDGKRLYSSGEDRAVKEWDGETIEERGVFPMQPDWPQSIALSLDNRLLAVGCHNGAVTLYDTLRRTKVASINPNRVSDEDFLAPILSRYCASSRLPSEQTQADAALQHAPENQSFGKAQAVTIPSEIRGTFWNGKPQPSEGHFYRFQAKKGQPLVLDVMARRVGSMLDSEIAILDMKGKPIERAVLRAVAKTEITLNNRDSNSTGIRLILRPEFQMNDYVLAGREVIQIFAMPKGPDDDYQFRNYRGRRVGFFGTTPEFHGVGEFVYKVEAHPAGSTFSPNGMPLTRLYYKNDDGGVLYGRDSYLMFEPPADGEYIVSLRDIRGEQSEKHTYSLRIHSPRPDFKILIGAAGISIPENGAMLVGVECERYEGFEDEIRVRLEGLPPGIEASETVIERGENTATLLLRAKPGAKTPEPNAPASYRLVATGIIHNSEVTRTVEPDEQARRISIGKPSVVNVVTDIQEVFLEQGRESIIQASIERLGGFKNRVPLEVQNLPHGVRVANVGLNGVLITEPETSRKIYLYCEPWVKPQNRVIYVRANVEGGVGNAASPLMLRIGQQKTARR